MLPEIYLALLIIFASSIVVSIIFQRLRQPSIVGFLLTGILVGPHALALIHNQEEIEGLAEIGVVMLLFTIGMEFSVKSLLKSKAVILLGGSSQVLLTIGVGLILGLAGGMALNSALFLGFTICLSSTAIGLSILQKYGSMATPLGRFCLLTLIFQDLIVVPLMLFTPVLGGDAAVAGGASIWLSLGKGAVAIAAILVIARWLMPWAINHITASRSSELFVIGLVALCIGICSLTAWAGLSLALGAFIAGLIIAESPYNHQAMGYIIPLRDLFTSVFFVSVGMLLDLHFVAEHPVVVLIASLVVFLGKTFITGGVALLSGLPIGQSVLAGLALAQISEFSFVLASTGMRYQLFSRDNYQLFLAAAVLTMIITPFVYSLTRGRMISLRNNWSLLLNLQGRIGRGRLSEQPQKQEGEHVALHDHVIIVGFGPNGRMMARACRIASIPYIIVEMNPATVRAESKKGENIVYGDAANDSIMQHVNAASARVLVVTATAPFLIRRVVAAGRAVNPALYIITRTRFVHDIDELRRIGANEVVVEEFETALNMFSRLLIQLSLPRNDISRLVQQLRHENYDLLKANRIDSEKYISLRDYIPHLEFCILRVEEGSPVAGQRLDELALPRRLGVNVLAIKRGSEVHNKISSDSQLKPGDVVAMYGDPSGLEEAQHSLFMAKAEGASCGPAKP